MCYIVAKKRNEHGCIACKTTFGKNLVDLKKRINDKMLKNNIQVLTISRPMAYGEYAPYTIINDIEEFEKKVYLL